MVIMCLVLLLGCAVKSGPVFVKGGREYGRIEGIWGGNFWNYYERGLSYADGEYWPLAINDFQQAARLNERDQRRIRIYGLHILDDYFPHRELGIAYYASTDYQKAIQELSLSLKYYPSAKAKYYLNRAREASLRQASQQKTASVPRILITSHQDQQMVRGFEAAIEGRAQDDSFVEKITVNATPYLCELAQKDMPFTVALPLQQGSNEIRVTATNLLGRESAATIHLIADRQAPILCIDDLRIVQGKAAAAGNASEAGKAAAADTAAADRDASKEIQIEGYVDDLCGVKTFQIDRQTVPLQGETRGKFTIRRLVPEHIDALSFVAEDQLGNRVEGQIGLDNLLSENGPDKLSNNGYDGLPGNGRDKLSNNGCDGLPRDDRDIAHFSGNSFLNPSPDRFVQVASLQLAGLSAKGPAKGFARGSAKGFANGNDTQPPAIRLDTPKGNLTVDWDTLFISGQVQDAGGIQDLLINDESILSSTEGKVIYFNHLLKLQAGKNTITVKAIDLSGNEKTKTVGIERKVNPVRQIASRMSMAIIPLSYRGDTARGDTRHQDAGQKRELMADLLTNAFVGQERFMVVDRQRIDRVMRQLQQEGKSDNSDSSQGPDSLQGYDSLQGSAQASPLELGKLVLAESVLAGRIYEDKGFVEIVARLIDTETSVVLDSQDVYGPADIKSITTLLEGLALKFKQSFPLVEGMIVEKDGLNIIVNLGKEKNIKKYTKYIVFREGKSINDPATQKVLEYRPDVLGEAKIRQVYDKTSEAGLISKEQQGAVRIKDRVITK
jgi:hypothetical protein